MRYFRMHKFVAAAAVLLLTLAAASNTSSHAASAKPSQSAAATPDIRYTVSMPAPHTHLLEVEMRLGRDPQAGGAPHVELSLPVWTPGSYLVRDYARHVQDFNARDAATGRALAWRKTDKNTWQVDAPADATTSRRSAAAEIVVTYRVYADELTVRTNELNDRHAFWNNAALLMHPDKRLDLPSTVRVVPFRNWKVATGLPAVSGQSNTFRAENFDVLYDSPFLASDFQTVSFDVRGVPHRIVMDGAGNYDLERIRRDTQKIVEASVELMGDVPYRDYTFILMTHPVVRGGLEHLNSTAIIYRRFGFTDATDYRDFLTLVAHEYFHLWNVKRIRPDALGPFDYDKENYTRLLWVAEGVTSYYESLLVRRAGLMTDKQYLELAAKEFQALQAVPGRAKVSVEEASFDAWIKYYRPDENTTNSSVSYYDKGAVVARLLDLEIRKRSGGAKSLDDVMRHLYEEFAKKNRNFKPEDFQAAAERMAGASLDEFFSRYVRGRDELNYNAALEAAGLRLLLASTADAAKPPVEKAYLGATVTKDDEQVTLTTQPTTGFLRTTTPYGALVIRALPAGSPGYEQGLNVGDQIIAVDGYRAMRDTLDKRLEEKKPGDTLRLTVFRNDELRTFDIKLGARGDITYRIVPVEQPTEAQMKIYQDWLRAPFTKGN